ncbi:histidine kinase [Tenacibaculum soleae]|uniref:histidine kinase n=1 Tax=Tenacibaculum soleae TaxID=447689 RepID=UPI00349F4596
MFYVSLVSAAKENVQSMIEELSVYYVHYCMKKDKNLISIKEELFLVKDYIEL